MGRSLARKLIDDHLVRGDPAAGQEIALRIDQTLTQDATGTLVMLALEAMRAERVRTQVSVQYVDHNILEQDHRNADDHVFLQHACRRFGIWYSGAGNGVSHPVHMERFGRPGTSLLGADSHTCAAGALGMLAFGAGGIEVAAAMLGEPYYVRMPQVWGVELTGHLPPWVSAKDVILEMLRRHGVTGGLGRIIEYRGTGVGALSAMDRHVIANMGAELGATTTVFPSDDQTMEFLTDQGRADDWQALAADDDAAYDVETELDLTALEPLIAKPSSPGNVVPVAEVAGEPIYQAYIGSSANPGYRDLAVAANMVRNRTVHPDVSFDINPASRQVLDDLVRDSLLGELIRAGARVHQTGCNGCIGMGQAPATGRNSLRTVPRNFPGRSGTKEDRVWLCSPETAAASALTGVITDPRTLGVAEHPLVPTRRPHLRSIAGPQPPPPADKARDIEIPRGPNIEWLPELEPLPDSMQLPVLLAIGDDLSTDEILPAGARVLPYRSNLPAIAQFCFEPVDPSYVARARDTGPHAIVAGVNYGQGSSREHAAFAPRYLGLQLVLARSFARIHWQNLIAYGVLPLTHDDAPDIPPGATISIAGVREALESEEVEVAVTGRGTLRARHGLSPRQRAIVEAGGLINWLRAREGRAAAASGE